MRRTEWRPGLSVETRKSAMPPTRWPGAKTTANCRRPSFRAGSTYSNSSRQVVGFHSVCSPMNLFMLADYAVSLSSYSTIPRPIRSSSNTMRCMTDGSRRAVKSITIAAFTYLPTKCVRSFSFSWQKYSNRSVFNTMNWCSVTVQGAVYALGSSTVSSISRFP